MVEIVVVVVVAVKDVVVVVEGSGMVARQSTNAVGKALSTDWAMDVVTSSIGLLASPPAWMLPPLVLPLLLQCDFKMFDWSPAATI